MPQDLLNEQNGKIKFAPFALGIASFALISLSVFSLFLDSPSLLVICFFSSFFSSILGLFLFSKDKINHLNLTNEENLKIKTTKLLLQATLIFSTLILIFGIGMAVYIGINGFGR